MRKKLIAIYCVILIFAPNLFSFGGSSGGEGSYPLEYGSDALRSKTIADNYYQVQSGAGEVASSVNLFTRTPVYSVPLGGISLHGQVGYQITLGYSGNTIGSINSDNEKAPSGEIGLGWGFSTPFVALNHKGTKTYLDDEVFVNLGPFGGGQLLDKGDGTFFVATNPYIEIDTLMAAGGSPLEGQIEEWVFTFPNGQRMIFGNQDGAVGNSERIVYAKGPILQVDGNTLPSAYPFIYKWDLTIYEDNKGPNGSGPNQIFFEYEKSEEEIVSSSSKWYTRESHVKEIKTVDAYGNEIQKCQFFYETLNPMFYKGFETNEPRHTQKLFETMYLDSVLFISEGIKLKEYKLKHTTVASRSYNETSEPALPNGVKRLLESIEIKVPHKGITITQGSYQFEYDEEREWMLTDITTPEGSGMQFTYKDGDAVEQQAEYILKNEHGLELPLPGNLLDWEISTSCNQRFCFLTATLSTNGVTHVEVYYNTGNHFDTGPIFRKSFIPRVGTGMECPEKISVIPQSDYFMVVEANAHIVTIYTWNGMDFVPSTPVDYFGSSVQYLQKSTCAEIFTDPNSPWYQAASSDYESVWRELRINVFPSDNFFLVRKDWSSGTATSEVDIYLKKSSSEWELLVNPSSSCVVEAPNLNENVKSPGMGCLEFNANVGLDPEQNGLHISTLGPMFSLAHSETGIVYTYYLNESRTGFIDLSNSFEDHSSAGSPPIHDATYHNNFSGKIRTPVQLSSDYFIVKITGEVGSAYENMSRWMTYHYNGDGIKFTGIYDYEADPLSSLGQRQMKIWPSGNHFITSNLTNGITKYVKIWRKQASGNSFVFQNYDLLSGDTYLSDTRGVVVKSNASAVFVNVHELSDGPRRPVTYTVGSTENYMTFLWHISPSIPQPTLVPDSRIQDENNHKMMDVTLSPVDNVILLKFGRKGGTTSDICVPGVSCVYTWYSNVIRPLDPTSNYVSENSEFIPSFTTTIGYYDKHNVNSSVNRLFSWAILNSADSKVYLRLLSLFGNSYKFYIRQSVVDEVITKSGLPGDRVSIDNILASAVAERVYNNQNFTYQFEGTAVKPLNSGRIEYTFNLDAPGNRLLSNEFQKNGLISKVKAYDAGFHKLSETSTSYLAPHNNLAWPKNLFVTRVASQSSEMISPHGGVIFSQSSIPLYNDANGSARLQMQQVDGSNYILSQNIYNGTRPIQAIGYEGSETEILSAISGYTDENSNGVYPIPGLEGISSTKLEYDVLFPYLSSGNYVWRDKGTSPTNTGQPLSDQELRDGVEPKYDLTQGYVKTSEVTRRNNFYQVVESAEIVSSSEKRYTSLIYNGISSEPAAIFSNCKLDNCAAMLGENGEIGSGLTTLDLPTSLVDMPSIGDSPRWEKAGAVFDNLYAHTGDYSLKVIDNFGPTINLFLKNVRQKKFGYVVSAWIYAPSGSSPVMGINLRREDGTLVADSLGTPVGGVIQYNQWQRWESRITHEDLIANGLFNTDNDYLRIFVGSPYSGGTVYVDDIVCHPDNATFGLTTYDKRGLVTSQTGTNHLTQYSEFDYTGMPIGSRNESFEIISQTGYNRVGENE